jgi:chemotaxis protein methyltransferase WspC
MNLAVLDKLIRDRVGLDASCLGGAALPRAASTRMAARGIATAEAYAGLAASEAAEWSALVGELVVPESWFFRGGRELFEHLARWLRSRFQEMPHRVLRTLSVPCCTGEEPYSLALALEREGVPAARCRIDAVDLAPEHLQRAVAGRYTSFSFRESGIDPRPAHFQEVEDGKWELAPEQRNRIRFQAGNLVDPTFLLGEPQYDLILCRNLFIYLTDDGRDRALANLERLLAPDGWLVLTPAEADRLPLAHFASEGPVPLAIFKRSAEPRSGIIRIAAAKPGSGVHRVPASPSGVSTVSATVRPNYDHVPLPPPVESIPKEAQEGALDRARRLADAGDIAAARIVCETALSNSAPTADLLYLLGVIDLAVGRSEEAADAFRKALYLAPDHAETLTHMAVLCDQRGDGDQAAGFRRRLDRIGW